MTAGEVSQQTELPTEHHDARARPAREARPHRTRDRSRTIADAWSCERCPTRFAGAGPGGPDDPYADILAGMHRAARGVHRRRARGRRALPRCAEGRALSRGDRRRDGSERRLELAWPCGTPETPAHEPRRRPKRAARAADPATPPRRRTGPAARTRSGDGRRLGRRRTASHPAAGDRPGRARHGGGRRRDRRRPVASGPRTARARRRARAADRRELRQRLLRRRARHRRPPRRPGPPHRLGRGRSRSTCSRWRSASSRSPRSRASRSRS